MARHGIEKLSKASIAKIKTQGRYCDGRGLWLQVKTWPDRDGGPDTVTRSWLFKFTVKGTGRVRQLGLGQYDPKVPLEDVRAKARQARDLVQKGIDPIEAGRVARSKAAAAIASRQTFKDCALRYIELNEKSWKNEKHRAQWKSTLDEYAYPTIGKLPVDAIETSHVLSILEPIWRKVPETAGRLRGRIEKILSYAKANGRRTGENPAAWSDNLEHMLPSQASVKKPEHFGSLLYEKVPAFVADLRTRQGQSARALEFLILTAARTSAVIGAEWSEINFEEEIWTIPPDRAGTKIIDNKPRRVPLSDRAVQILRGLPREDGNPFVFIGGKAGRPLSNMAMLKMVKERHPDCTTHGFRASFKTWAIEVQKIDWIVSNEALQHTIKDTVERAYMRGDMLQRRIEAMQQWADYCNTPAQPVAADTSRAA